MQCVRLKGGVRNLCYANHKSYQIHNSQWLSHSCTEALRTTTGFPTLHSFAVGSNKMRLGCFIHMQLACKYDRRGSGAVRTDLMGYMLLNDITCSTLCHWSSA